MTLPPIRSWLYAPGNNAKLLERVFTAGADAVILDLEDAVPDGEKDTARAMVAEKLASYDGSGPPLFVRINHPSTTWAEADVKAVARGKLAGLRVPKVNTAAEVQRVAGWLDAARCDAVLACNIESALGVWNALEVAAASPRVMTLAFAQADLSRDLSATPGPDGLELLYARSRVVLACRVAGIRPPVDTVYTNVHDDEGLARAARQARAMGFFGKSAIHPKQVAIINEVFTPAEKEVDWARNVVSEYAAAAASKSGAFQSGGQLIDTAIVRRAEDILKLADAVAAANP